MFYQSVLSPQLKRSLIINNKLVYTSSLTSCQTASDLGSEEIRKVQNDVKISWNYNLVPSFPLKKKVLSILAKDFLKIEIERFPQCPNSRESLSFCQILCPPFFLGTIFIFQLVPGSFKIVFFDNVGNFKFFNTVLN